MSSTSKIEWTAGDDYSMSSADAAWLKGVVLLPIDLRRELMTHYLNHRGSDALVELVAQFIGMANSVVSNSRECIELFAIVDGEMHPYAAEKINLPTIFGALSGVDLIKFGCEKMCGGCAFRLGTPANQSPVTTCDADFASDEFMCHEHMDDGVPTRRCLGAAKMQKHKEAAA